MIPVAIRLHVYVWYLGHVFLPMWQCNIKSAHSVELCVINRTGYMETICVQVSISKCCSMATCCGILCCLVIIIPFNNHSQ